MVQYVLGGSSDDLVEKYMTRRDEVLGILKLNSGGTNEDERGSRLQEAR